MKNIFLVLFISSLISCKKEDNAIIKYDNKGKIISKIYANIDPKKGIDSVIYYNNEKLDTKVIFNAKNNLECWVKICRN